MKLQRATRTQARIRIGLQGPSGSGKTYGALLLAYGLCGDWEKIAVIDTEHNSAALYAHLGAFYTTGIAAPFSPEKYIHAIQLCENEGMEVIIIDSASHEWEGAGGILDIHGSISGGSFQAWNKVTPRHNAFVQAIMQSRCHVITTIRSKQDYVLVDKNGRPVPEKVGLKAVQRDGLDYEFTIMLDVDCKHHAVASKDRTSLFTGKPEFRITPAIGQQIRQWCEQGATIDTQDDFTGQIDATGSIPELLALYQKHPEAQATYLEQFSRRRKQLELQEAATTFFNPQNITHNGKQSY